MPIGLIATPLALALAATLILAAVAWWDTRHHVADARWRRLVPRASFLQQANFQTRLRVPCYALGGQRALPLAPCGV